MTLSEANSTIPNSDAFGVRAKAGTTFTLALVFVLFIQGAIPFLFLPTLGQGIWTLGFAQSFANQSLFSIYSKNFGFPFPAPMPFGLAGAWPMSLLLRAGLYAADAYTLVAAFWFSLGFLGACKVARMIGLGRTSSHLAAAVWLTLPMTWAHSGYGMLSFGMALLPFYFRFILGLFLHPPLDLKHAFRSGLSCLFVVFISVFMDGYTFVMFFVGSVILGLYFFVRSPENRRGLAIYSTPIVVICFICSYVLYICYLGTSGFRSYPIDFFRGWGVDLSFLIIPTKGIHWLPDLLGLSRIRSDLVYWGDDSVWCTTFLMPIIVLGLFSWWQTRRKTKLATGFLLIALFGFYMALGPSLKVNSLKPEALRLKEPHQKSAMMPANFGLMPTGSGILSENVMGFDTMRSSYRWSALGALGFWLLLCLLLNKFAKQGRASRVQWVMIALILANMPSLGHCYRHYRTQREQLREIDSTVLAELMNALKPDEKVAFLPYGNDFFVNYLAAKTRIRSYNIGGDKNVDMAIAHWPTGMKKFKFGVLTEGSIPDIRALLENGVADSIVVPYLDLLWSAHTFPCKKRVHELSPLEGENPECPPDFKIKYEGVLDLLKNVASLDLKQYNLFFIVHLKDNKFH